jgi:hypothetical protein
MAAHCGQSYLTASDGVLGGYFGHVFAKGSEACKASEMLGVTLISRPFKFFVLGFDFESPALALERKRRFDSLGNTDKTCLLAQEFKRSVVVCVGSACKWFPRAMDHHSSGCLPWMKFSTFASRRQDRGRVRGENTEYSSGSI